MRILMTTDTIGGVWTMTCELTQQLLERDHAVALVSFGREPNEEQKRWSRRIGIEYGDGFMYRACDAPLEWMEENGDAYLGGAEVLLRTADEFGADLLHSNQFCWGALPRGLPCLITAHSDVMSWSECCRADGLERSEWLTQYLVLVQRGLDDADMVVAPTDWMRSALTRHFRVPCTCLVIANGRTITACSSTRTRRLQAISVGRLWDEAKGISTLLAIESPMPIVIAGSESFESVRSATGSLEALGVLDEAALFTVFYESSIYIASSLYEPFGLAPLEAALCGCAVVARDLASLREVWSDAALFYNTPDELVALLRALTRDAEMLRAAQGRAWARAQRFTAACMADAYIEVYDSLVGPARKGLMLRQELVTHAT